MKAWCNFKHFFTGNNNGTILHSLVIALTCDDKFVITYKQ